MRITKENINKFIDRTRIRLGSRKITKIDYVPEGITHLHLGNNDLTELPKLPDSLKYLYNCGKKIIMSSQTFNSDLLMPSPSDPIITATPELFISSKSSRSLDPVSAVPIILILLFLSFLIIDKILFDSNNDKPCNPPDAVLCTRGDISHELDFFLITSSTPAALADLIQEPRFRGS